MIDRAERSVETVRGAPRMAPDETAPQGLMNELGIRAAGRLGIGLNFLLGRRAGNGFGIITYHRIAPRVAGLPEPLHNVTPQRFREQVAGLLDCGFVIRPLKEILECRQQGTPIAPRTVVLTFDDGFETVYTNAWPVLRQLGVPATVFLATAYLDGDAPFCCDAWGASYKDQAPPETYRPLSTAQCREMAADGLVNLASHTHTHQDFRNRPEEFREDLEKSIDILRTRFGQEQVMFAFPYGSRYLGFASEALTQVARQAGVRCGLTMESMVVDVRSDPFTWGRFNAFSWDTSTTLAAKLNGWYAWAPKLRQQMARLLFRNRKTLAGGLSSR